MAEVEKVARELLAAEVAAAGWPIVAEGLREGETDLPGVPWVDCALRAIQAAYVAELVEAKGIAVEMHKPDRGAQWRAACKMIEVTIQARIDAT